MISDAKLSNFLAIKQQIADLEKELKPLKSEIEASGSFETKQFKVEIVEVEQNRVVDANTLLEKLGPVKVTELELIKTSTYNKVNVKRIEKKAA
jgi:hypothetical protein